MKGQISIDLLITLLAAIIVITAFGAIIVTNTQAQEKASIQNQLSLEASKLASIITASGALNDTKFTIEFQSNPIYFTDANKNSAFVYASAQTIDANTLKLWISKADINQSSGATYYANPGVSIAIADLNRTGIMVVSN